MVFGKLKAKFGGRKRARDDAGDTATQQDNEAEGFIGPSPNPKTNLILADLALRGSSMLMRQAIERGFLGRRYAPDKANKILKGRTIAETVAGTAIVKVATRSVPGAILVGGGLLAKTLYDRRRGKFAQHKGEVAIEEMETKGSRKKA